MQQSQKAMNILISNSVEKVRLERKDDKIKIVICINIYLHCRCPRETGWEETKGY